MTQEEKNLVLQDLCARLPYGVIVQDRNCIHPLTPGNTEFVDLFNGKCNIKPFLRPLSSMTEEEKKEVKPLFSKFTDEFGKRVLVVRQNKMALYQDWLNSHHFDYRGLIEKGLALEASKGMYNIKEK